MNCLDAVEAYFAFAELPATLQARRFTITFTYMEGGRLDRLQWWWQLSAAQERSDGSAANAQRQEAVDRFSKHIERWLINSQRRLTGGDPFPATGDRQAQCCRAGPIPKQSWHTRA